MVEICPTDQCSGCMACMAVCGVKAISVKNDNLGFSYPHISETKCVDCGMCKKVCPTNKLPNLNSSIDAYAFSAKDEELLKKVSSGGVASILSEWIIAKGGVVYGCNGQDIINSKYNRADSGETLHQFRGSKYFQSDFSSVYTQVRRDLNDGRIVLVVGISCQIAGLRKYLNKEYTNLYTIDMICHGAASQLMVKQSYEYYCRKHNTQKLDNVKFRRKSFSNSGAPISYGFFFSISGREYSYPGAKDMFTLGYATNILFRDSCYQCKYTQLMRVGDLTIGDFWRIGADTGLSRSKGVSLVIPHTDKGMEMMKVLQDRGILVKRTLEEAINGNPQLLHPTEKPVLTVMFRENFPKYGLIKAVKRTQVRLRRRYMIHTLLSNIGVMHVLNKIRRRGCCKYQKSC